jgi:hypothetical protein
VKKYLKLLYNQKPAFIVLAFFALVTSGFNSDPGIRHDAKNNQDDGGIRKSIKVAGVKALVSNDINTNVLCC